MAFLCDIDICKDWYANGRPVARHVPRDRWAQDEEATALVLPRHGGCSTRVKALGVDEDPFLE